LNEAVELYENAIRISPNNPTILYALALAHRSLGNFDKAIEFAKK
jgi:tetratricopeptide (TPR) repeat protein